MHDTAHSHSPHVESHFESGALVRDVVIGMADGLTVPFALAAGAFGGGELDAPDRAGGDGGDCGRFDRDGVRRVSGRARRRRTLRQRTAAGGARGHRTHADEEEEIYEIFEQYGVERVESASVLEALKRRPQAWVDFMMRFELGLEKPEAGRAWQSALTIALSYIAGGLVPLVPYILMEAASQALLISVGVTLVALFVFGGIKGRITGSGAWKSAFQTTLIGGLAAGAAFGLAKLFNKM